MRLLFSVFASLFLLTGCDFLHNLTFGVLHPMGEIAKEQKDLLIVSVLLMLIVVIPVLIMTPVFAFKFREGGKAKYEPKWAHNTALELIWWGVPCLIIIVLACLTWVSSHKLDPYKPLENSSKPIKIQAVALTWKWLFIYPEQNIATVNYLQFPVNVSLNVEITADAPMNSLMIPQLGGQIYAMEGMTTKIHWIANKEGEFRGHSSNYSGHGFAGMNFKAKATSQEEFDDWVKSVKSSKNVLTFARYEKLAEKSMNDPVQVFSSVENNLFGKVLEKFTKYMPHHSGHKAVASRSNHKVMVEHSSHKKNEQKEAKNNHHYHH